MNQSIELNNSFYNILKEEKPLVIIDFSYDFIIEFDKILKDKKESIIQVFYKERKPFDVVLEKKPNGYRLIKSEIQKIDIELLNSIADDNSIQKGLFYAKENDHWVACDNSRNEAFFEEFKEEKDAINYLFGHINLDDIEEHIKTGKLYNKIINKL